MLFIQTRYIFALISKPVLCPVRLLILSFFLIATQLYVPAVSFADTLIMPGNEPTSRNIDRPVRGLTMQEVEQQFGAPPGSQGPVGNPPITRWIYDQFTVVFEDNIVIHSFIKN